MPATNGLKGTLANSGQSTILIIVVNYNYAEECVIIKSIFRLMPVLDGRRKFFALTLGQSI